MKMVRRRFLYLGSAAFVTFGVFYLKTKEISYSINLRLKQGFVKRLIEKDSLSIKMDLEIGKSFSNGQILYGPYIIGSKELLNNDI